MNIYIFLSLLVGVIGGGIGSYFFIQMKQKESGNKILKDAEDKSKDVISRAEAIATSLRKEIEDARNDIKERKQGALEIENRLAEKEQKIDRKYEELEGKQNELRQKESSLDDKNASLDRKQSEMEGQLEKVAKLSTGEAREILLSATEERYEKDIVSLIEKKKKELKNREADMAREILIKSVQQYAGEVTGETTQTMVQLESDDLKGKIIGKEGRNIIAFEKATGVSLIIDDAPDTVFLSSFDLFRRYIAKKSLEDLIADKRIQPARIEEIVEKNQQDADKLIYDLGRKTIDEMGIIGIPEEIIPLIGKFRFRTSYGQNILMHSKEVAYIAEAIAKLIGADPVLALKGGLLHDLGKAMDHDIEGTHPEIGGRIARKYGLDDKVTNIIEGHHDDVPQICIETKIVQIADAISAVRPGARRMNVEDYVKRIQEMENIAMSFPGVNKAYALSAGREVRVFVDADTISDLDAEKRAREIAVQIEANCNYPGEVKINLIREKRVIEYAK
ncbi:ribonuclease Y [Candidatus Gracilibacteria bacterium]|nr:ribonuclease Y [Candidatus Gracilibacteria bacterium]